MAGNSNAVGSLIRSLGKPVDRKSTELIGGRRRRHSKNRHDYIATTVLVKRQRGVTTATAVVSAKAGISDATLRHPENLSSIYVDDV